MVQITVKDPLSNALYYTVEYAIVKENLLTDSNNVCF